MKDLANTKYEYKEIVAPDIVPELNHLGKEGWRLHTYDRGSWRALLERVAVGEEL